MAVATEDKIFHNNHGKKYNSNDRLLQIVTYQRSNFTFFVDFEPLIARRPTFMLKSGGFKQERGVLTKIPKINKRGDYYLDLESKS